MVSVGFVALVVLLVGLGAVFQFVATRIDSGKYPMPGERVDIGDLSLHIDCKGVSDGGATLVVDAGAGQWSVHWAHIQKALSDDGRVCVYDRAGFGWSDSSQRRRDGATFARQLHDLLDNYGESPPFLLAGHSLGGFIARLYHNMYPGEVAGIALIESGHELQFERMPELTEALGDVAGNLGVASSMARFGFFRAVTPPGGVVLPSADNQAALDASTKTVQYWQAMELTFPSGAWIADEVAATGSLGDLPLLVLSAGSSASSYCEQLLVDCKQTEEQWDTLQADLVTLSTNAQQYISESASHDVQIDDPDFVISKLKAFWRILHKSYKGKSAGPH